MKKIVLLMVFSVSVFLGCVQGINYAEPTAPIFSFENFEKAISSSDYQFAWDTLSPGFKERRFENSFDSFKEWAVQGNPEFDALFEGEHISEIVVEQNLEMLLRRTNGDIRFVDLAGGADKDGIWKMDSVLIPAD